MMELVFGARMGDAYGRVVNNNEYSGQRSVQWHTAMIDLLGFAATDWRHFSP